MQKYLPKHLAKKSIALPEFSPNKRKKDWRGKPTDWSDIRKDCPTNSIALYAGVKSDYSAYDNLGFTATVSNSGQYKVYIDETLYGTYNSGAQCSITWSNYTATVGESITTPEALTAHKIWIEPETAGNNITAFRCQRVAASGSEDQGVLWEHFNLTNSINIYELNCSGNLGTYIYANKQIVACTAKNNIINASGFSFAFLRCGELTYIPNIITDSIYMSFANCVKLKQINIKGTLPSNASYVLYNCRALEKVTFDKIDFSQCENLVDFLTNANKFKDTVLNMTTAIGLKKVGCYGSSTYFMTGLKGLRASSAAPFTGSAPQINVSYTGLDSQALVQLFNDLPTVNAGQIINVVGTTGAGDLTAEDEAIATEKGWTITK